MTSNQPSSESHSSVHNHNDNVSHSGDPDGDPDPDPDADADVRSSDRSNPAPSTQPAAKRTVAKRSRRSSVRVQESKDMTSTTSGATRASQRHHHQRNASSSPKHRLMSAATQAGVRQTEPYNFFYTDMVVNLFGRDDAEEFREPVLKKYSLDIIPDYKDIVKTPMDLGTIKNRLANTNFYFCKRPAHTPVEDRWKYLHELDPRTSTWFQVDERKLLADIRLVFENCKIYNDDSSDINQTAIKFMKDIDAKLRLRNKRLQTMKKAALNAAAQAEIGQRGADNSKLDSSVASGSAFALDANGNTAEALEQARLEAEEEKRKALEEMRRKELEWQTRLEAEKDAAVKAAVAQVNQHNSFIIQQQQYQQELQTLRMHQMQHEVRTQLELLQAQHQQQQQQHHGPKQLLNNALQQGVANVPSVTQPARRHSKRGREITRVRYTEDDADDDEDEYEEEDSVIVDGIADGQEGGREGGGDLKVGRTTTITITSDSVISDDQQHAHLHQEQHLGDQDEEMHADGSGGSGALGIGGRNAQNDVTFVFVSTDGMEKKRGRKSARVGELELEHEGLVKRRKMMVDTTLELEKLKQVEMTVSEKRTLCEEVAGLDYVRMKGVVDLLARGLSRPDLLSEVEIDLDMDAIDNVLLREIQFFLRSPVAMTAKEALRTVEEEIVEIEKQLVAMRYQKVQKDHMIE